MANETNCVIYARYSSDRQTYQSIEGQLTICRQYAKENNLHIVDIYKDEARTGTNDNRPAFQQMLKDSQKGTFKVVLVYALDRFGRNRIEVAVNKHALKKNNVVLVSATQKTSENIDGSKNLDGILLESVYEGLAEYYSAELGQKVKRGQSESFEKGQFMGGYVPFGYDIIDKKHSINQNKSLFVQRIFDEYVAGNTVDSILDGLKKDNIFNDRGKNFSKNSIMKMLANEVYVGNLVYGGKRKEGIIPAIITQSKFDLAKQRMDKNKRSPGHAKADEPYLLTGKLFCGYCKNKMLGESGTSKTGTVYHYYKCYHQKRKNLCEQKTVPKNYIETKVVADTIKWLHNEEGLREIAHCLFIYNQDLIKSHSNIDYYQSQLKQVNKSIDNLLSAIEAGVITSTTKERMLALEEQKSDLESQIAEEEFNQSTVIDEEDIFEYFNEFTQGNIDDEHYIKKIIDTFINKVILFKNKIVIVYNFSGKNTKEFDLADFTGEFNECDEVRISTASPRQVKHIRTLYIVNGLLVAVYSLDD